MENGCVFKCVVIGLLVVLQTNFVLGYCSSSSSCDIYPNWYCCKDNTCCTSSEYDDEQDYQGYCSSSLSCTSPSYPYCCSDNTCCSASEYSSETVSSWINISVGAIIGIVIGGIVLIVAGIVGCVFCCCRPNTNNRGRVIATTTTAHQPVMMQQHQYANQAAYPVGQPAYAGQPQPYPSQPVQPPYNSAQFSAAPPEYPTKPVDAPPGQPPSY